MTEFFSLMDGTVKQRPLQCPSATPRMSNATLLGVVIGIAEQPRVIYLNERVAITEDILAQTGPFNPTEVFRFSAPCQTNACKHFDGTDCQLAVRLVRILPAVVSSLPACQIRRACRWYCQEGAPACFRCPQVVTENHAAAEDVRRASGIEGPTVTYSTNICSNDERLRPSDRR